ncbi:Com family DNA-binding transcriptional regulator [Pseudomonas sp. Z1-14]|uniref:Com family DNA-binding transcriptional regulator n=1 Tax=Pseudomonas sp. Z1-14 TaxID=2817409 RepID=UPI003DA7E978
MQDIRCDHCCRKLASGFQALQIKCLRCRTLSHIKGQPTLPGYKETPEQKMFTNGS